MRAAPAPLARRVALVRVRVSPLSRPTVRPAAARPSEARAAAAPGDNQVTCRPSAHYSLLTTYNSYYSLLSLPTAAYYLLTSAPPARGGRAAHSAPLPSLLATSKPAQRQRRRWRWRRGRPVLGRVGLGWRARGCRYSPRDRR
eukprot:scaffold68793_cov52-Phaeocystis_antarctica.AAC.2